MFRHIFSSFFLFLTVLVPLHQVAQTAQTFSYTTPICRNGANQFPKTSSNWQGGSGGFFFSQPGLNINPTTGQINAPASSIGTYTVTYTNGLCGCTPTTVVQIVNPSFLAVSGNTACLSSGPTTTLSAVPPSFVSYTWSFNSQHNGTTTINTGAPGPHTLSATDANGCRSFTVFNVTFYGSLNPFISASPNVCLGSTITLFASGANSFTWSTGATTSVIAVSPSVNTVYTVSGKDFRGCIGSATQSITVLPVPTFSVSNYILCQGQNAMMSVTSVSPDNVSFMWVPGSLKGNTVSVSPSQSTNYTVTGYNAGCTTSKVLTLTLIPSFKPSANFSYTLPLCGGQSAEVFPDTVENFTWGGRFTSTEGDGFSPGLPLDSITGKVRPIDAKPGTYLVTYSIPGRTLATEGCTIATTNTAIVSIIDSTALTISPDIEITEGENTKLSVSGGENYQWFPATALSCTDCAEPTAWPSETTTYCVRGISNSCYSSACVKVDVVCHNNNDFSVPTAFTPNGDGLNEELCLRGWEGCNRLFQIKIFNRWGEQVFESSSPTFCWDGKYNGVLLDADVYAYFIKARFFGEPEFVKSGNITILR